MRHNDDVAVEVASMSGCRQQVVYCDCKVATGIQIACRIQAAAVGSLSRVDERSCARWEEVDIELTVLTFVSEDSTVIAGVPDFDARPPAEQVGHVRIEQYGPGRIQEEIGDRVAMQSNDLASRLGSIANVVQVARNRARLSIVASELSRRRWAHHHAQASCHVPQRIV